MKAKILILVFVVLLFAVPVAHAADIESELQGELDSYNFSEWDNMLNSATHDDILSGTKASELIENYINGKTVVQPQTLFDSVKDSLIKCLRDNVGIMLAMLALAIAIGLSNALLPDEKSSIREVVGVVLCTMSLAVVVAAFARTVATASNTIDKISDFSQVIMPVSSALLIASGRVATAGVFTPLMSFMCAGVISLMKNFMMPLILLGGILSIIGNLTPRMQIKQLQSLCKTVAKWGIGLIATLYAGIVAINGMVAGSHDGLGVKTIKFLLDKTVPIAGQFVSGTLDTVLLCSNVIKSAAGIASIVIILCLAAQPLLNLLCANAAFRLSAAFCEPISDDRLPKMLISVADMMSFLFATVLVCCAMFVITIGMLMVSVQ